MNPRGGLRSRLLFGSFPRGRLGKHREIKKEQQILLVIQEGGGCRGRGFKRLWSIFRPSKMNSKGGGGEKETFERGKCFMEQSGLGFPLHPVPHPKHQLRQRFSQTEVGGVKPIQENSF